MKQVDTRGLSCPQPVMLTLQEINKGKDDFDVLMDSEASCENVKRLLEKHNLKFDTELLDDHTVYHVTR